MELYPTPPAESKPAVTSPVARDLWSIQRRLRFCWKGNHRHVERAPSSKRRWKREDKTGRALLELPVLGAGVARLATRSGDDRARQVADQLTLITPEGLGLMRYRRRPGERRAGREGWYIPAARDADVSAFLALVRDAYYLVTSWSRTLYRETRQLVAGLARAMRRDLSTVNPAVSPHPTIRDVSLSRDISCSSETRPEETAWERCARRFGGGGGEVA